MDNQQKTLELIYLAGLMDGEGCFSICKSRRPDGKTFKLEAYIQFTNTDPVLLNEYVKICENLLGIKPYIRLRAKSTNHKKDCYEVAITSLKNKKLYLESIIPYLRGKKKSEAEIVLRFVNSRLERNHEWQKNIPKDIHGRFTNGGRIKFNEEEWNFHKELKESRTRGFSETTRDAPDKNQDEDIVQS